MKPLITKLTFVAVLLLFIAISNKAYSQDLEFTGVKKIENKEIVKFSILGIQEKEDLAIVCKKINKLKGISVKSYDLRNNIASVKLESDHHISASEIRQLLVSLGYDLTSISVKPNNSSEYRSIKQKEKELRL